MSVWCSLFGHNYSVTSTYGNYAFCSRCGAPLTIKEPHILAPGERRWINSKLMEMTELGLEEVILDEKTTREILTEEIEKENTTGDYTIQSKDPHTQ